MTPVAAPVDLPEGYGEVRETLSWEAVRGRLEASLHYWVATVRPDGRPHAVPRWGVWLDDTWFYDGSPETRHAQNVARNPAVALHLESGEEAVIVEGTSEPLVPDPELAVRLAAAFRKYHDHGYAPDADSWNQGGLWRLVPSRAMAWTDFPGDATRFTFE